MPGRELRLARTSLCRRAPRHCELLSIKPAPGGSLKPPDDAMLAAQHTAARALAQRRSPAVHRPARASLCRPAAATARCCLQTAAPAPAAAVTVRCCLQTAAPAPAAAATTRRCRSSQPARLPLPQQPHHGTRSSVATPAMAEAVMGSLASVPWAWAAAAVLVGVAFGLGLAKLAEQWLSSETDPYQATLENAELREKVEDLQQLVLKLQPLAYKGMRMRFTKGINKSVVLGMVDKMLENKEVNLWWLPDAIERVLYFNVMGLMLAVLDETVASMSINFAGHNVKLQLTYLDVAPEGAPDDPQMRKTQALLDRALEPLPPRAAGSAA